MARYLKKNVGNSPPNIGSTPFIDLMNLYVHCEHDMGSVYLELLITTCSTLNKSSLRPQHIHMGFL
jgi:hypothetical protein